jgi:hypothetical protein
MEWMTVEEALANGWTLADTTWQRGYVSRRVDVRKQVLQRVPNVGKRARQYYFDVPSFTSTYYCRRQYINPPTAAYYREVCHGSHNN